MIILEDSEIEPLVKLPKLGLYRWTCEECWYQSKKLIEKEEQETDEDDETEEEES